MGQPVPSLSTSGWIRGAAEKADTLIAYFMVSNYSQTRLHLGNVKSMPYLIQKNPKDFKGLKADVESAVYDLLRAYFDDCSVVVEIVDQVESPESKVDIQLTCTVTQDGNVYNLAKMISFVNSKFRKITDLG